MSSGFNLTRVERDQLAAVEAVFKPWGLTYVLERTHHLIAVVTGPRGGHWRLVLSCTPRDDKQAIDHARQKARRVVKDINRRLGL